MACDAVAQNIRSLCVTCIFQKSMTRQGGDI